MGVAACVLAAAFAGDGTIAAALGALARLADRVGAGEAEEVAAIAVFAAFAGCEALAGAPCFDTAAGSAGSGVAFARGDLAVLAGFAAVRGGSDSSSVIGAGEVGLWARAGLADFAACSDELAGTSPFGRSTLEATDVAVFAACCDLCATAVAFDALMRRGWLAEANEVEEVDDIAVAARICSSDEGRVTAVAVLAGFRV